MRRSLLAGTSQIFIQAFHLYAVLVRTRTNQTIVVASPCVAIQEDRTESRV